MIDYKKKEECVGCGACISSCPVKCIHMQSDEEGFLYPVINKKLCINCNLCIETCDSLIKKEKLNQVKVFAAASSNENIKINSSSGGIFYELAKAVIKMGGVVYGAAYANDYSVIHKRIEKEQDILELMGSKYVQSNSEKSYNDLTDDLKEGRMVLYTGTPCQVKRAMYISEKYEGKLYAVSVICHGVPSPLIWDKYVKLKKGQYSEEKIKKISFRDKRFGWKNFSLSIKFNKYEYIETHNNDLYMKGFLSDLFLRPSCYTCQLKGDKCVGDLIIGDYWGIQRIMPNINSYNGFSSIIVNSKAGDQLWSIIKNEIIYYKSSYEDVVKENQMLEESAHINRLRQKFFDDLRISGMIEDAIKQNLPILKITENMRRYYQYDVVYKIAKDNIMGKHIIRNKIEECNWHNIVLYSITDLLDLVILDIKDLEINIWVTDKNYNNYEETYNGYKILELQKFIDMTNKDQIDAIIICNIIRKNEIEDELQSKINNKEKINSLLNILF